MAVPTSNYGISAIYSEANGGPPGASSNIAVSDLFKKSVLRTYYDTMKKNARNRDMAHELSIAAVQEKHGSRGLEHIEKHLDAQHHYELNN